MKASVQEYQNKLQASKQAIGIDIAIFRLCKMLYNIWLEKYFLIKYFLIIIMKEVVVVV
jgi:hypothetical protein